MNRFLTRAIATFGLVTTLNSAILTSQAIAQPVSWQLTGFSLEPTFPNNDEQRSHHLKCLLEQAQLGTQGRVPAYLQPLIATELLSLAIESQQQGEPTQAKQTLSDVHDGAINPDLIGGNAAMRSISHISFRLFAAS